MPEFQASHFFILKILQCRIFTAVLIGIANLFRNYLFIILESGYYFLNPDGFRFLFPVERVFFIFSFLTGTVLLVSLILYKKKIAFVCLILCSIYLFCAVLCLFLFHISLAERVLGILSFSILLLWIFFIWKDLK